MDFIMFGFLFFAFVLAFGFLLEALFFKSPNALTVNPSRGNMQNTPLNLVSTDELIAELQCRYDHMVFMGLKHKMSNEYETKRRYTGNLFLCLGLATNMQAFLNGLVAVTEQPHDGKGT